MGEICPGRLTVFTPQREYLCGGSGCLLGRDNSVCVRVCVCEWMCLCPSLTLRDNLLPLGMSEDTRKRREFEGVKNSRFFPN